MEDDSVENEHPRTSRQTPDNYNPTTGKFYTQNNTERIGLARVHTTNMFKSAKDFLKDTKMRREACHNFICKRLDTNKIVSMGL